MTKQVYASFVSTRHNNSFNSVPYKNGEFDPNTSEVNQAHHKIFRAIEAGDVDAREQVPTTFYRVGKTSLKGELKPVTLANDKYLILRHNVVSVLKRHDLGEAKLTPVTLLDCDNVTPIETECFILLPGTRLKTVDLNSPKLSKNRYSDTPQFALPSLAKDIRNVRLLDLSGNQLAMWWDDSINSTPFLKEGLVSDLKKTGFDKFFALVGLK